jgi:hypothetical protein
MLKVLLFTTLLLSCLFLNAQRPGGGKKPGERGGDFVGQISGKIIDKNSNKPMEYATITVFRMRTMELTSGITSGKNGEFLLDSIKGGMYQIRFSFIGYATKIMDSIKITPQNSGVDLGKILLSSTENQLDEVDVTSDKAFVRYEIDKKVIDVSNLNTTASESAVEVLENVPSINVDIDGNVSLRGNSSFTLLIDNKPTNLDVTDALKLIPATAIQEIEIITNPSARYDAEGVSGIINIILKKNRLSGISALINANTGTNLGTVPEIKIGQFNQLGGDFLVNINHKKTSLTIGGNYKEGEKPRYKRATNETIFDSILSSVEQEGIVSRNFGGYGANFEFEWRPNRKTIFTAGGKLGKRKYNSSSDLIFKESADNTLSNEYHNIEIALRDFLNYALNASLIYNFRGDKKHYLNIRTNYNVHDGNEISSTEYFDKNNEIQGGNITYETGPSNMGRINLDYVRPLYLTGRFEAGLQAQIGVSGDKTTAEQYDTISEDYMEQTAFNTSVDYFRNIYAGYSILAGKYKKIGYQFGFRGEYTDRTITSTGNSATTKIDRLDLFPSAHFSYELDKENQFMANASRRIQRPRSWYFEPFITWQNAFSVRTGNARLIPEYILSYEIGWIRKLKKGNFSLEAYHKDVSNKIQRISSVYSANVIITKPENIGKEYSTGIEASYNYPLAKWWKLALSGNAYNYKVIGQLNERSFDQQSFSYNGRINNTLTLKGNWRLQFTGKYNSAIVTPLGNQSDNYSMDLSIKKDFNDKKMSASMQVRDVFSTTRTITEKENTNLKTVSFQEPITPMVSIAISMRLNNYNRKPARPDNSDEF